MSAYREAQKRKIGEANARVCTNSKELTDALRVLAEAEIDVLRGEVFKVAVKFAQAVAERTPFETGRAMGGWQIGYEPSATEPPEGFSGTKEEIRQALQARVNELDTSGQRPDVIYVSNNVQYIMALEAGHSQKQAPAGMIAITLDELTRALNKMERESAA